MCFWTNAAQSGSLIDINSLHCFDFPGCTTDTMDYAALIGNLPILYFLFLYRNEGCSDKAIKYASAYGHLETVKFLYMHYPHKCNIQKSINIAKFNNHQDIVKFLEQIQQEQNILKQTKCIGCNVLITKENNTQNKNKCSTCYYIKEDMIICVTCDEIITLENYSNRIKRKCKNCYNRNKRLKRILTKQNESRIKKDKEIENPMKN